MRFPASITPNPKGFIVSAIVAAIIVILLVLYAASAHAVVDLAPAPPRAKDVPMTEQGPTPSPRMQITLDMVAQMCDRLTKNEDLPIQCAMATTPEGQPGMMFLFLNREALSALWTQVASLTAGPFCSIHNKANAEAFVSVSLLEEKMYRVAECKSGQLTPWMPWTPPQEEKE